MTSTLFFHSSIGALFDELGLGPQPYEGLDGEARRFEAADVRTPFFVIMWLVWLPDYIIGQSHGQAVWWKDDDVAFSAEQRVFGRDVAGGVRPTTVLCDLATTSGATLLDAGWNSERELQVELLEFSKEIVANPGAHSMPGWESMEKALGFLKDDARHSGSDCARKGPLLAFLSSVGIGI